LHTSRARGRLNDRYVTNSETAAIAIELDDCRHRNRTASPNSKQNVDLRGWRESRLT
jgi:uncharacterized protein YdeI (BOF family)